MAHEVSVKADGTASAIYAHKPAWHGLGTVVPDLMTTNEMLNGSGIAEVTTRPEPVFVKVGEGYIEVPDYTAVVREGSNDVLGIHGDGYVIEEFASAFQSIGASFGNDTKIWETGVLLRGGKIAAGVMRFPDFDRALVDGSHLMTYIAAYTSHDGSYALTYKDTNIRIECANLLRAADYDSAGRRFAIRHTSNKEERKSEAIRVLTYAQERVDALAAQAERLIAKKISDNVFQNLLDNLIPIPDEKGRGQTMARNRQAKIKAIYSEAPDQQPIRGTAWGALQAVGAFVDHEATYRQSKNGTSDENRFIRTVMVRNTIADEAARVLVAI